MEHAAPQTARWRALASLVVFSTVMPATMFIAAGRIDWGMGWLFVVLLLSVALGSRFMAGRRHPDLIEERATSLHRAEVPAWDRALVGVLGLCPLAMMLIAGLNQRYGWTPHVPSALQWAAAVAIVGGGMFSGWAMVVNRFFSAVVRIQRDRGQSVVTAGPYRVVRHPGYAGSVVFNLAAPLMLDAYWAFIPGVLAVAVIVIRTSIEDRMLRAQLDGYEDYAQQTRFRLVPGIW
ncbi:MAG: isoprenylcysteine carboxylmethyltransferase family protein [Deltaproteobacteria bacterium]|nr:isoprenylcysteine carboxylmethyltransferase family protein [Deltaproteobacteria bacterium]